MDGTIETRISELIERIEGLSSATVQRPAFVYFDIVGIGWPIRCLLHLQDIDYDYIPISIFDWIKRDADGQQVLKQAFRNGHVPYYVDADVALNQSNLILTHLARKANMLGGTERESLAIQEIMVHCYDALFHWNGMLGVTIRTNIPDEVAQARLHAFMGEGVWGIVTDGYRNHLDAFVRYLNDNATGSGFLVGERLSVADLHAFNVLCNWYKAFDRQVFSTEYPQLDAYIERIADIPGVSDYIRRVQEPTVWFPLPQIALRLTSPEELAGLVSIERGDASTI